MAKGGRATPSFRGEIDFVVAGSEPGTKLDRAKERGICVLDESKFRKMLEERA